MTRHRRLTHESKIKRKPNISILKQLKSNRLKKSKFSNPAVAKKFYARVNLCYELFIAFVLSNRFVFIIWQDHKYLIVSPWTISPIKEHMHIDMHIEKHCAYHSSKISEDLEHLSEGLNFSVIPQYKLYWFTVFVTLVRPWLDLGQTLVRVSQTLLLIYHGFLYLLFHILLSCFHIEGDG